MFEPGFEAFDIFLDLLEEGQIVGQLHQSRIWRDFDLIERRRTGRDLHRVERVVLGAAQMHPAERLDLGRLQHQHREACCTQMFHHATLIAAGRLNADACHASLGQLTRQQTPAGWCIGDLPTSSPALNRNVELGFGRIDFPLSLC